MTFFLSKKGISLHFQVGTASLRLEAIQSYFGHWLKSKKIDCYPEKLTIEQTNKD